MHSDTSKRRPSPTRNCGWKRSNECLDSDLKNQVSRMLFTDLSIVLHPQTVLVFIALDL